MRNTVKYFTLVAVGLFSLSACTMGDKGSEKVPDSVSIDTNITPAQPSSSPSDTSLIDSLQTDTTNMKKMP